jgi:hypothetical protein
LLKVFISGRYERRDEFNDYRIELEAANIEVTSRWLTNPSPAQFTDAIWHKLASIDREDIERADAVLFFADVHGGAGGARHVEFGIGLALGKCIIVVGEAENLFQRLSDVTVVAGWPAFSALVDGECGR